MLLVTQAVKTIEKEVLLKEKVRKKARLLRKE